MNCRFINDPIHLEWMGWETDTARLADFGWDISVDQNIRSRKMQIALRYERNNQRIYGISEVNEWDYMDYIRTGRKIGSDVFSMRVAEHIQFNGFNTSNFCAVDARPSILELNNSIYSVEDYCHFQKIKQDTKEIILQKASMEEVLAFALSKQESSQAHIRKQMIKRQEMEKYRQASEVKAQLRMVI